MYPQRKNRLDEIDDELRMWRAERAIGSGGVNFTRNEIRLNIESLNRERCKLLTKMGINHVH